MVRDSMDSAENLNSVHCKITFKKGNVFHCLLHYTLLKITYHSWKTSVRVPEQQNLLMLKRMPGATEH